MSTVPAVPEMLRVATQSAGQAIGVDREANVLRGYIVAEAGDFKDKRGTFDRASLERIVQLGNATSKGLRSRLSHPNESDDGLTKHLGRSRNFRLDPDGSRVRADLHLAQVAMEEPVGGGKPIGEYAMDLALEDPGALGSSLVLKSTKTAKQGPDGERLPPHWMPEQLFASDLVADGDATHGDLLSVEGLDEFLEGSGRRLPTKLAVAATEYLNQMFPDADRDVLEARLDGFRDRYLNLRFGDPEPLNTEKETEMDQETKSQIDSLRASTEEQFSELKSGFESKLDKLEKLISTDIESRQQEKTQKDRAAEIAALCKQAGDGNAEQYINDDSLSVEDVMRKLIAGKSTSDNGLSTGGGEESLSPVDKLRRDFDSKKEYLTKQVGWKDRETWVKAQCLEKDIEYTPAA